MHDDAQPQNRQRKKLTKADIAARDAELRSRPFKSNGGEDLDTARLRVKKMIAVAIALAASRGQGRGRGIESAIPRKNSNVARKRSKK